MLRMFRSLTAALALSAMVSAAPVAAASSAARGMNPMVALSAFGSAQSRAALCSTAVTSAAAAAAATQVVGAQPGCVLPVVDAPPPPVISEAPPPPLPPLAAAPPVAAGFSAFPLLLGLAGIAAAVLLFRGDKDGRIFFELQSPQ